MNKKFSKKKIAQMIAARWLALFRKYGCTYSGVLNDTLYFFLYICRKKKEWKA